MPIVISIVSSPEATTTNQPLIWAAGGIATASQVAAVLTLGADAAVLGTRLLVTPEATYTEAQKELLIRSESEDAVRTTVFDEVRGTKGWPAGVDGRAIRNKTVSDAINGSTEEERKKVYEEAVKKGDVERIVTWSGSSVSLINQIQPASEVISSLARETRDLLQRSSSLATW